jgi:hypothetical protein
MRRCPRGPFQILKHDINLHPRPLGRPRVVDNVGGECSFLIEWHLQRNALPGLLLRETIPSHQAFYLLRQSACHQNQAPKVAVESRLDHERRINNDPRIADLLECFQLCTDGSKHFRMQKSVKLFEFAPITKNLRSQFPAIDLTRISQYVATMQGSGPLYDELHTRFEAAVEPSPLHRFLARLPALLRERGAPHQLIVTTNYDLALERAFEEAGEELDIVSYVATGTHRGRFWHRPPGEPPRPIDVPNTYATELSLERRTILLKLHGAVDPLPEREWESFVITEDDYIDYLGRSELTAVVPVALAAKLRRSHFLFLGYEMADWNLRLILGRIWGDRAVAYGSWAVQPSPSPLERAA